MPDNHDKPSHMAAPMPNAAPDPDPLVRELADTLWQIETNYQREGSGHGSRFAGERLETVQARYLVRRVRESLTTGPAREKLARHLWIADAGGAKLWDSHGIDRTAWLDRADVLLAVITGKEG